MTVNGLTSTHFISNLIRLSSLHLQDHTTTIDVPMSFSTISNLFRSMTLHLHEDTLPKSSDLTSILANVKLSFLPLNITKLTCSSQEPMAHLMHLRPVKVFNWWLSRLSRTAFGLCSLTRPLMLSNPNALTRCSGQMTTLYLHLQLEVGKR
jgi:hypothetical protein